MKDWETKALWGQLRNLGHYQKGHSHSFFKTIKKLRFEDVLNEF